MLAQPVFTRNEILDKERSQDLLDFVKSVEYQQANRNLIAWWGVSPFGLENPIESSSLLKNLRDELFPEANSITVLKYLQGFRGCDRIDEGKERTVQVTLIDYDKEWYDDPPTIQMVWDGTSLKELNHGEITFLSPGVWYGFCNHHNHYQIQFKKVEFGLAHKKLELHRKINNLSTEQVEKLLEITNQFKR